MKKSEQIGKVKLDYTHYTGDDLYCDGEVEDVLLSIVKECSPVEFPSIIEEKKNWPIFYHLSQQRENIVSWLPIESDMKVLEIGSGCGAITGVLSKKAKSVTCVELSQKRSMINAYRHDDCENITIHVGNFTDIEPSLDCDYDYALLIGVFEYGKSYINSDTPYEDFLKTIRGHLSQNGVIVMAIENRFGMKYWAGCREDHLGTFFGGIEGYTSKDGVETFSQKELEDIFRKCNEKKYSFYYPYPDYKFMTSLFSDERLPQKGELTNNLRNFDSDRMMLFDERKVFDSMIEEGKFPFYSNSYLVVLGDSPKTKYVRFSNDRAPAYQIYTEMTQMQEQIVIKKHALSKEAVQHIRRMEQAYPKLTARYCEDNFRINPILHADEMSVTFAFERGIRLSEKLDELIYHGDMEGFRTLFSEYVKRIGYHAEDPIADYDLAFSNIIMEGDIWKVIDYEWTFEKSMPTKELAFRALYCYILEDETRNVFDYESVLGELGITEEEAAEYRKREAEFQKTVTGNRMSMGQLRESFGGNIWIPWKGSALMRNAELKDCVQIYFDRGNGFCEEDSCFAAKFQNAEDFSCDENGVELSLPIDTDVKQIRIDPCMDPCIVRVRKITLNGGALTELDGNGRRIRTDDGAFMMVFSTTDPGIAVRVGNKVRSTGNTLFVSLEVSRIPVQMAQTLEGELRKKIRL